MDDIQVIFTVGACIFGASTLLTFILWVYFICRAYKGLRKAYTKGGNNNDAIITDSKGKAFSKHLHRVHWLRSIWIYGALFAIGFVFTIYYSTSALGAGLAPTSFGSIILWSQWLVLGLVGIIAHVLLAFVLTHHIGDYYGNEFSHSSTQVNAQSLWIILFYFICVISLYFGTLSDLRGVKIVLIVFAPISFILSALGYFFPFNKITFITNGDHHDDGSGLTIKDASNRHDIVLFERYGWAAFITASMFINFLIWLLSESNGITDKIDFQGQVIAYLVTNVLLYIPMLVVTVILSFKYKQKGVQIKTTTTDSKVHYAKHNGGSMFSL